jgi:hypothetical protein
VYAYVSEESSLEGRLSRERFWRDDELVRDEVFDDATIIMEALLDIRADTQYIIELLEEDDGAEETENA